MEPARSIARFSRVPAIACPAWQFILLAEIANFFELRRHLGCARADLLVRDVIDRLMPTLPDARIRPVGRDIVEVAFSGETMDVLASHIDIVRASVATPFPLDGESYRLQLVVGAASAEIDADDVRIVEEAEAALAQARAGNGLATHDVGLAHRRSVRELAGELHRAVDRDELLMVYQPKVHVRQQEIQSAEALVRWRHPTRGLILPGEFIPAAEEGQVIDRMTLWTIARVIADQRTLSAAGHDLRIYINIAGQLLSDAAFVREACELVTRADAMLGFEVTETSVIRDPDSAIANLQMFADHGIHIAIDDYGAGLSSLAYLKQLPAQELKIDKLFVTQLTSSHRDPLIVRSTIDLAHALEMEVVAEGVETHAAMALLTVMGCDIVQGFLISRPIVLEALIGFLAEKRHGRSVADQRDSLPQLQPGWKRA